LIFYTIVPIEELLSEEEDRSLVTATLNGRAVMVEPLGEGKARIERLLSTDPDDYLDGGLGPGNVVRLED